MPRCERRSVIISLATLDTVKFIAISMSFYLLNMQHEVSRHAGDVKSSQRRPMHIHRRRAAAPHGAPAPAIKYTFLPTVFTSLTNNGSTAANVASRLFFRRTILLYFFFTCGI